VNYFILTARAPHGGLTYYCAQNITRNVYPATASDKTVFLCSGQLTVLDTKDVVCITSSIPCSTIEVK
jgi:hypothetical protein